MKKLLSLFLVFAYLTCMVPVMADPSAQLENVKVSRATLVPAFSAGVFNYDVIVDDQNAALPELTISGQHNLTKEAKYLGDKTIVNASGTEYTFTYRAPYNISATSTSSTLWSEIATVRSGSSYGDTPWDQTGYIRIYKPNLTNFSWVPLISFDLSEIDASPFGKYELSLAVYNYGSYTGMMNIKAVNIPGDWKKDTATYNNTIATVSEPFDNETVVSYDASGLSNGTIFTVDISSIVKKQLLNGKQQFTLTLEPQATNSIYIAYYRDATNAKYEPTLKYYPVIESSDATLKSVTVTDGELKEPFSKDTYEYSLVYEKGKTPSIEYVLSESHANAEITYTTEKTGTTVIKVTAQDGSVKEYKFNYELFVADTSLKSFSVVKNAILLGEFDSKLNEYNIAVKEGEAPEFIFETTNANATAVANYGTGPSGKSTVTITADEAVQVYTFNHVPYESDADIKTFTAANSVLLGTFSPDVTTYDLAVRDNVTPVFNYTLSGQYATAVKNIVKGSSGTSTVTVTAQDGTTKVYTFNHKPFDSDATLKSVVVTGGTLNKEFDPEELSYEVEVPKGTTPNVTIKGTANSAYATVVNASGTTLNQTVKVTVTAQDGTKKEYSFKLIEEPERSVKMLSAEVPYGTIAPTFKPDVLNYMVGIEPNQPIPDISYTLEDANSSAIVTKATKVGETTAISVKNGGKTRTYNFKFVIKNLNGTAFETAPDDIGKISSYETSYKSSYQGYQSGSEDFMVQRKVSAANHSDVWVKLDLTGKSFDPFGKFGFKFYAANNGVSGVNYQVKTTSYSAWQGHNTGKTMTYDNTLGNGAIYNTDYAKEIETGLAGYKEFDITEMVQAELAKGNTVITVAVALSGNITANQSFRFRNSAAYPPSFSYESVLYDTVAAIESIDIKNGALIGTFSPDVKNYTVAVAEGKTPEYSYVLTSNYAKVDVIKNVGSTIIKLTSQDGSVVNEYKFTHKSFDDAGVNENGKFSINDGYISDTLGKKITTLTPNKKVRYTVSYSNLNTSKKKITLVTVLKTNGQILSADDIKIVTKEVDTETSSVFEEITLPSNVYGVTLEGYVFDSDSKIPLFNKASAPKEAEYTPVINSATLPLATKSYGSKVVIYGKATPNALVPVVAVKPGTVLSSLTKDNKSMIAIFDIAVSDSNGIWEKEVTFPANEGWYKIYAGGVLNYVEHYVSLVANKSTSINSVYNDIFTNPDSETAKADIKAYLNTTSGTTLNKDIIGITKYPELNEDDLIENLYNIVKETYSEKPAANNSEEYVQAFFDEYEKAVTMSKLNASLPVLAKEVIDIFNLTEVEALYNNVQESRRPAIDSTLKGGNIKSTADVEKLVKSMIIFDVINYPESVTIAQNTIEANASYLGFDLTTYNTLNNQSYVVSAFVTGGPYSDLQTMINAFSGYVTSHGTTGGGNGGGTGGGSSGGSYAGSTIGGGSSAPVYSDDFNQMPKAEKVFGDVSVDHWAYNPTKYLSEKGIVQGVGDGSYEPDRTVAREEFTKIICLAFNVENAESDIDFTDVSKDSWYYEYVKKAVAVGALKGISDTEFGSGQGLRREDAALIIYRVLNLEAKKGETFGDDLDIADYAKDAVYTLKEMGVLSGTGNGNFEPKRTVTRAECAKIIYELIKE